jgi:trigger factor
VVETQLEEVAENRVRMRVEVPQADVQHAVEHAASDLAQAVKIPGFRKGRVPMPVLISRIGKDRVYREAVDSHISGWFWNAVARNRVRPIEQPQYGYDLPTSADEAFAFTAEFAVEPRPELPDWRELEVPYPDPELPAGLVEHELDVLRSTVAELAPVEGRPAQEGDTLVVDLVNTAGESQRDYVVELGQGRLVEELEQGLLGMSAGETKQIEFERADEQSVTVDVTVKEVKEKVLPPLDDDLARAASEFDTLDELRNDIESRLREQLEDEAETAFRAAVVDELVTAANVTPSGPLVEARTESLLRQLAGSVERRGISFETYLTMTGTDPRELVERLRAEAGHSVARELVLEAAAEQLGISVADEEVDALIREQAEAAGEDADETLQSFRESAGYERLREDLRLRNTLDRLASDVKRIPVELAEAREAIWTPEKEKPATETKIWTPGSKE